MKTENTIKTLLENSPDGTITARQITESGMHRSILQKLVRMENYIVMDEGFIYGVIYGKMTSICCSAGMDEASILMIQRCTF